MSTEIIITIIGFIITLSGAFVGYGRLVQKTDDTKEEVNRMFKELRSDFDSFKNIVFQHIISGGGGGDEDFSENENETSGSPESGRETIL